MRETWRRAHRMARGILRTFEENPEKAPRGMSFNVGKVRCKRTPKGIPDLGGFDNVRFITEGDPAKWPPWMVHLVFQDGQGRTPWFLLAVQQGGVVRSVWESGLEIWELTRRDRSTTVCRWNEDGELSWVQLQHPRWGSAQYEPSASLSSNPSRFFRRISDVDLHFPRFLKRNSLAARGIPLHFDVKRAADRVLRSSRLPEIAEVVRRDFA